MERKFETVPKSIIEKVNKVEQENILSRLFGKSIRCKDLDAFNETLSEILQQEPLPA